MNLNEKIHYLKSQRWFQHKGAKVKGIEKVDTMVLSGLCDLGIFRVELEGAKPELYLIPELRGSGEFASVENDAILRSICSSFCDEKEIKTAKFSVLPGASTNTLIACNLKGKTKFIVKLIRKLVEGDNVEASVGRFLSEKTNFTGAPACRASTVHKTSDGKIYHTATAFDYIENDGNAWERTLEWLKNFIDEGGGDSKLAEYKILAENMGKVLAGLHVALSSGDDALFKPRRISREDVETWRSGWVRQADRAFGLMRKAGLSSPRLDKVKGSEDRIRKIFETADEFFLDIGWKIRQHADFHLGQILVRGDECFIIDFEGEPLKDQSERAAFYPALKDAAGMVRSFNYASFAAFFAARERHADEARHPAIFTACREWERMAVQAFLEAYYGCLATSGAPFIPSNNKEALDKVLSILILDKALYEVEYEINNRPTWLEIPLGGISDIMEGK